MGVSKNSGFPPKSSHVKNRVFHDLSPSIFGGFPPIVGNTQYLMTRSCFSFFFFSEDVLFCFLLKSRFKMKFVGRWFLYFIVLQKKTPQQAIYLNPESPWRLWGGNTTPERSFFCSFPSLRKEKEFLGGQKQSRRWGLFWFFFCFCEDCQISLTCEVKYDRRFYF